MLNSWQVKKLKKNKTAQYSDFQKVVKPGKETTRINGNWYRWRTRKARSQEKRQQQHLRLRINFSKTLKQVWMFVFVGGIFLLPMCLTVSDWKSNISRQFHKKKKKLKSILVPAHILQESHRPSYNAQFEHDKSS